VPPDDGDIVSAACLVLPAPSWNIRDAWSVKSEKLHGVSLGHLREHGRPVKEIAEIINRELAGYELVSDNWVYDERWLWQIFEAAAVACFHR
jgi:hypothetical protein